MAISTELDNLKTHIIDSYNAINTMGGTIPANKNMNNLPTAIQSIPVGSSEKTGNAKITGYDYTTGVITGSNFGSSGKAYILVRNTHSYAEIPTSRWSNTSITLTNPIDRTSFDGSTCIHIVPTGEQMSNKFIVWSLNTLIGQGIIYIRLSDGTIHHFNIISSDMNKFVGASNCYASLISLYDNELPGYRDVKTTDIVGMQLGTGATTIPASFCRGFTSLNQPLTMPKVTSIGNYFLSDCTNFNSPISMSETAYSSGSYFLYNCISYNQPLELPSGFVPYTLSYFMSGCTSFNQPLDFSNNTNSSSIGSYFMQNCTSMNSPITFNNNITSLDNYFLTGCSSFNSKITMNGVTSIGQYFMQNCSSYNQPIDISDFTSSPSNFMRNCSSFNQPLDTSKITSFGTYFLAGCSCFNQPIDISKATTIGTYFMYQCRSFDQPLTFKSNLASIQGNFLRECWSFSQKLTLPAGCSVSNAYFMYNCFGVTEIDVSTATISSNNYALSSQYNNNAIYTIGVTLYGTNASTWKSTLADRTSTPFRKLIDGTI